jgi:hypothetical protein
MISTWFSYTLAPRHATARKYPGSANGIRTHGLKVRQTERGSSHKEIHWQNILRMFPKSSNQFSVLKLFDNYLSSY